MFAINTVHCTEHRSGHHGMALFTDGQDLYASHLPLYRSPHDYQLIYQIKSNHQDQLIKNLEKGLMTILPQHFDLNTLIEGGTLTIKTTIYDGHFERGGQKKLEDESFTFQKQIFKRQISNLKNNSLTEDFFLIDTSNSHWQLAIHAIQARPSFDMIALFNNQRCHINKNKNTKKLQLKNKNKDHLDEAQTLLNQCAEHKVLYFETQDFREINNEH